MRPLRGGQGTFDKIVANVRAVAGKSPISIGGNFDADNADSYPALLDFLAEQEFASQDRQGHLQAGDQRRGRRCRPTPPPSRRSITGIIPLTAVAADGAPLGGTCMTVAGAGGSRQAASACDSLPLRRRDDGLPPRRDAEARLPDHRRRPHGPVRDPPQARPHHRSGRRALRLPGLHRRGHASPPATSPPRRRRSRRRRPTSFDRIGAWRKCGDCSFIPVCAGGCSVASHTELGDMDTPTCHRPSLESALVSLAADAAAFS